MTVMTGFGVILAISSGRFKLVGQHFEPVQIHNPQRGFVRLRVEHGTHPESSFSRRDVNGGRSHLNFTEWDQKHAKDVAEEVKGRW
jgi:hypothetical protein